MATDSHDTSYAAELGERLRRVRVQQDLSLHDVERASHGRYKASVLGAYERGERSVSVARLRGLADFYRVPLSELIPPAGGTSRVTPAPALGGLKIDLAKLDSGTIPEAATVGRYVSSVQARRGDYNGRLITLRRDDLRALAAVLDVEPSQLRQRLADAGVVVGEDAVPTR